MTFSTPPNRPAPNTYITTHISLKEQELQGSFGGEGSNATLKDACAVVSNAKHDPQQSDLPPTTIDPMTMMLQFG